MIQMLLRRPVVVILFLQIAVLHVLNYADLCIFRDIPRLQTHASNAEHIVGFVSGDPEPQGSVNRGDSLWLIPFTTDDGLRIILSWKSSFKDGIPEYGDKLEVYRRTSCRPAVSQRYFEVNIYRSKLLSKGNANVFLTALYRWRRECGDLLELGIQENKDVINILHSVLLGYKYAVPYDLRSQFALTGTLHIFAISGLHVSIIAFFLIAILRYGGISRQYWFWWVTPMLIVYAIATGARASTIRACLMMALLLLGPVLSRKADVISSLAFSAFIILLFAPQQLYEIGFILSYIIVTGIVMVCPHIERPLRRLASADSYLIFPEIRLVELCRKFLLHFITILSVSVSAWLVSVPLTIYFFHQFCPIAPLCNLLVIPIIFVMVIVGCLSLVSGACISMFSIIFNRFNVLIISALLKSLDVLSSVPYASIEVPEIGVIQVFLYYLFLGGLCYAMHHQARRV